MSMTPRTADEAYRRALVRLNLDVARVRAALDEAAKVDRPDWGHVGAAGEAEKQMAETLYHAEGLAR